MTSLKIKIVERGDKEPAFPELLSVRIEELRAYGVGIIEEGTEGGKASIGVFGVRENGSGVFIQFTENLWDGVASAVRGAISRFNQNAQARDQGGH